MSEPCVTPTPKGEAAQEGEAEGTREAAPAGDAARRTKAGQYAYPPSCRLHRPAEFRRVYEQGQRFQTPLFAAFCLKVDQDGPRIGFTTPRALGKAVARNRMRRRLREQVRLELLPEMEAHWWIVFNPRRSLADAPVDALKMAIAKLRAWLKRPASTFSADIKS
jgi:ribonuclease P protein component